ncbi:MAG: thiol reductant ABC exporter subunit CydC [Calditrichia bacterium]
MKPVRFLYELLSPTWKWILLGGFVSFLTTGSGIGLMMTSAYIISKAALHPSIAELQLAIVGVRFFGLSRAVFRYLERLITHDVTFKILSRLRVTFYQKLIHLVPAKISFFRYGAILDKVINGIDSLQNLYLKIIVPLLSGLLSLLLLTFIFIFFDPMLSIIITGWIILTIFLLFLIFKSLTFPAYKKLAFLSEEKKNMVIDLMKGLGELLVAGQFDNLSEDLQNVHNELSVLRKRISNLTSFQQNLTGISLIGIIFLVSMYLSPHIQSGAFDGLYLAVILLGIMAGYELVFQIVEISVHLPNILISTNNLLPILSLSEEKDSMNKEHLVLTNPPTITFNNVTFSYEESGQPVFQNLNFTIPAGQITVIQGPSGIGKSTLIHLLLKFWPLKEGDITIDHTSISNLSQETLLSLFSIKEQTPYIFAASLEENLKIAKPDANESELIRALKDAGLESWFKQLPNGLTSWIGEYGSTMSAGERQRLGLARIILQNKPIVILDEPTENLDKMNKKYLYHTIKNISREKTAIIISHESEEMLEADRFIHLEPK